MDDYIEFTIRQMLETEHYDIVGEMNKLQGYIQASHNQFDCECA